MDMTEKNQNGDSLRRRAEAILELQPENLEDLDSRKLQELVHELHVHQIELEIQNEELLITQKALTDARTRYLNLYNNAPVGYVVLDPSGLIKETNTTFADMVQLPMDAIRDKAFAEFMIPRDESIFRSRLKAFYKNPSGKQMELRFKRKDHEIFFGHLEAVMPKAAKDRRMTPSGELLITISDVTLRKKLEARLAQKRKMETIATLSGGIAHDYNNLLSAILGNIELLRDDMGMNSQAAHLLDELEKASFKARDLTRKFMILAKGEKPVRKIVSLEKLIADAVENSPRHSKTRFEINVDEDLRSVNLNSAQMQSAFENIFMNAAEAMPRGGVITIKAENFLAGNENDTEHLSLADGEYVKVSVEDEGVGIPKDTLARIFDPYFSTKEMGHEKGMGLGLATTQAIVLKHDGHIEVNSRPGEGTRVTIYLPAQKQEKKFQGPETQKKEKPLHIKRVLIMDDEEMLRNLATQMLKHLDIESKSVSDGLKALEAYETAMNSEKPFDAVILDLTVKGGMGGRETITKLLEMDPDVNAIVSSGYFDDPVMADFKTHGFRSTLPKPYSKKDLEKALKLAMA